MKNRFNSLFLIKVVNWILLSYLKEGSVPLEFLIGLINRLDKIQHSRGTDFLILFLKDVRGNLMNYLSGSPERLSLSKTSKDGIPIILGDLIPIIRGKSFLAIAMIYTILFSTRSLKTGRIPDITPITSSPSGDLRNIEKYMDSFWRTMGYRYSSSIPKYLEANTATYRSKAGPNGHALVSSYIDAMALPESLVESLKILGGETMISLLRNTRHKLMWNFASTFIAPLIKIIKKGKTPSFRRLSYFPDKESKVRVVGILDWFSQVSLKPLHNFLMKVLSKIPQDCTNDQQKFIELLKNGDIYYSIDLTNATDRFPISIISRLLKSKLPSFYVNAWVDCMIGYPFDFTLNNLTEKVIYKVGNPMGAYSSFTSFALAHHYIIYYCCKETNVNWKQLKYALLGDDIVICDKIVAERYISLLKQIGVEYSPSKTHKSKEFYEFAKRIFYKSVEVSPFPISALHECSKSFNLLFTLIWSVRNKGSWIPKGDVLSTGLTFFRLVKGWRRPYLRNKVSPRAWLLLGILDIVSGLRSADDFLNEIIRTKNYRLPILSQEVCKNILVNCIVQAFADSNIAKSLDFGTMDMPLYGINFDLSKSFTMFQSDQKKINPDFKDTFLIFFSTPISQARLAVEYEYQRLLSDIIKLDKSGEDWSFKLRTFALPKSDKSLLDKGDYLLSKAARSFGDLVDEQLMILQMYPQLIPSD